MVSWSTELLNWVPPGLSGKDVSAVTTNTKYFAYHSFYSVYVYRVKNFALQYVYNSNTKTVISIALNPIKKNIIAISFSNNKTEIFDILEFKKLARFRTTSRVTSMIWVKKGNLLALYTIQDSSIHIISPLQDIEPNFLTDIKFECHFLRAIIGDIILFIFANRNGQVDFFRLTDNDCIDNYKDYGKNIVSVSIDTLNNNNVLILFQDGSILILDVNTDIIEIQKIPSRYQNVSVGCWVWQPPGHFITGDQQAGIVRIWSPANETPLESINVYSYGFRALQRIKKNYYLCVFNDYKIAIFDIKTRKIEWSISAGHNNTIFCAAFDPIKPNILLTGSADGILCIRDVDKWENILSTKFKLPHSDETASILSMTIEKNGVYAIIGLRDGSIALFNLKTYATKSIFSVSDHHIHWITSNPSEQGDLLVWTDGPELMRVDKDTCEVIKVYQMPHDSHCAMFSNLMPDVFATACDGGYIDVYKPEGITTFKWGDITYLTLCWSYFEPSILCAITEEGLLFKVDINTEDGYFTVIGSHKSRVRTMTFHPVLKDIVATGGYDGIVQIYDVEKRVMIASFTAHTSYVYSVEFCRTNPFSIVTSGRDSCIRIWSLENILYNQVINYIIFEEKMYLRPIAGNLRLSKLVDSLRGKDPGFINGDIVHIKDRLNIENDVKRRMKARKSKEKLYQLAEKSLLMGDKRKYCEILFDLGEYDKALSAAPSVSYEFWMELIQKVSENSKNDQEKAIYKMMSGDMIGAARIYADNEDFQSAYLCIATGTLIDNKPKISQNENRKIETNDSTYILDLSEMKQPNENQYLLASNAAKEALSRNEVYVAAAYYLSVGDAYQAISVLLRCGEIFAAASVDRALHLHDTKTRERFARMVLSNNRTPKSFDGLTKESKSKVFASLYFKTDEGRKSFQEECKIEMIQVAENDKTDQALSLLYQFRFGDTVSLCVNELQKIFCSDEFDFCYAKKFVDVLELYPIGHVGVSLSAAARCAALFLHAYTAAWKGYSWCFRHIYSEIEEISQKIEWFKKLVEHLHNLGPLVENNPKCKITYSGAATPNPIIQRNKEGVKFGAYYETEDGLKVSQKHMLQWIDLTSFPIKFSYYRLFY